MLVLYCYSNVAATLLLLLFCPVRCAWEKLAPGQCVLGALVLLFADVCFSLPSSSSHHHYYRSPSSCRLHLRIIIIVAFIVIIFRVTVCRCVLLVVFIFASSSLSPSSRRPRLRIIIIIVVLIFILFCRREPFCIPLRIVFRVVIAISCFCIVP